MTGSENLNKKYVNSKIHFLFRPRRASGDRRRVFNVALAQGKVGVVGRSAGRVNYNLLRRRTDFSARQLRSRLCCLRWRIRGYVGLLGLVGRRAATRHLGYIGSRYLHDRSRDYYVRAARNLVLPLRSGMNN
jgi:hypothetical protein